MMKGVDQEEEEGFDKKLKLYMPHEIITREILPRLSAKSICKFKSVCKLWRRLPRDPTFVQMHLNHCSSSSSSSLLILSHKQEAGYSLLSFYSLDAAAGNWTNPQLLYNLPLLDHPKLVYRTPFYRDDYIMESSCHGLVCFSSMRRQQVFVCNPSTNEIMQIPTPNVGGKRTGEYGPCKVFGFGFDPAIGKYKVMCGADDSMNRFVFTLDYTNGKWRKVDDIPHPILPNSLWSPYLNGSVHWIIEECKGILSFNFEDERYRVLSFPKCDYWSYCMNLLEHNLEDMFCISTT